MAMAQMSTVIRQLRRAVVLQDGAKKTDGELLASFIEHNDEAAFEVLVHRHGPMVMGVCRRLLRNHHDAEDAFQATFLVLARKARSVRPREMVANWLHGVAYRIALKARAMTTRRQAREKQVMEMPERVVAPRDHWNDLRPLLDKELNALPETYRLPILLCDLEGKSIKDATRQLGWPQGTLAGRLARGRKMLAKRLARRGVALAGALLAGVPASLVSSTAKAAGAIAAGQATVAGVVPANVSVLMEGVMNAMLVTKLKLVMAVMLVFAALSGIAGVVYQTHGADTPPQQKLARKAEKERPATRNEEKPISDIARLQGTWKIVSWIDNGVESKNAKETKREWTIKDRTIKHTYQLKNMPIKPAVSFLRFRLDERKHPKRFDFVSGKAEDLFDVAKWDKRLGNAGDRHEGIYSITGNTLRICFSTKIGKRPITFESKRGSQTLLIVLKRINSSGGKRRGDSDKEKQGNLLKSHRVPVGNAVISPPGGFVAIAKMEKNGYLKLRIPVFAHIDSKKVKRKEHIRLLDVTKVLVVDTDGKRVEPARLRASLKEETPVLFTIGGKQLQPMYLRLFKKGTLIFVFEHGSEPELSQCWSFFGYDARLRRGAKINRANYYQLKQGMTFEQVVHILGCPPGDYRTPIPNDIVELNRRGQRYRFQFDHYWISESCDIGLDFDSNGRLCGSGIISYGPTSRKRSN